MTGASTDISMAIDESALTSRIGALADRWSADLVRTGLVPLEDLQPIREWLARIEISALLRWRDRAMGPEKKGQWPDRPRERFMDVPHPGTTTPAYRPGVIEGGALPCKRSFPVVFFVVRLADGQRIRVYDGTGETIRSMRLTVEDYEEVQRLRTEAVQPSSSSGSPKVKGSTPIGHSGDP